MSIPSLKSLSSIALEEKFNTPSNNSSALMNKIGLIKRPDLSEKAPREVIEYLDVFNKNISYIIKNYSNLNFLIDLKYNDITDDICCLDLIKNAFLRTKFYHTELAYLLNITAKKEFILSMRYLLEKCSTLNVNSQENFDKSALHTAAFHNKTNAMIKELIILGANIDLLDKNGQTPLHRAAKKDNTNAIKELIRLGANVNLQDNRGQTPLHIAAIRGHPGAIKELISSGANVNLQDNDGHTAFFNSLTSGLLLSASVIKFNINPTVARISATALCIFTAYSYFF